MGGQDKVYEVKKEVWNVVWSTRIKEFIAMTESMSRDKEVEVTINTYDNFEEAEEIAQELTTHYKQKKTPQLRGAFLFYYLP